MPEPINLTWNEALSGICGSISLASWVFVMVPQLAENYRLQSAEGLSLTFLIIWFVGDAANLAGAIWAKLVPTVIAIAIYFCFMGILLIGQCVYYNNLNKDKLPADWTPHERDPLLGEYLPPPKPSPVRRSFTDVTDDNLGLPGSRRRSSGHRASVDNTAVPRPAGNDLQEPPKSRAVLMNALAILAVIVLGTGGWALAWQTGTWRPNSPSQDHKEEPAPIGAEILGYISAALYLGARIPQIMKNQRDRSCDGLSLLFFMFSMMGNITYGGGILFHSLEHTYVMKNLPWLIGSLGTIAEDITVFVQFHIFGERDTAIEIPPDVANGRTI